MRRKWMIVAVAGLWMVSVGQAVTVFEDQFDGTAADPDSDQWFPNDGVQGEDFDSSVVDGKMRAAWANGGAGGDGSGFFSGGPLGKIPVDMDGVQSQVWTWRTMNISDQTAFTDFNNIQSDVLFTAFETGPEMHENNRNTAPFNAHFFGIRVFHLGGSVVLMEQSNPNQYNYLDGLDDGRLPTDWRMTVSPSGAVTVEADQSAGWVELTHTSGPLQLTNAELVGADQYYPMFRHRSQMDWDPHYPPEGSMMEFDYINGELIPEPATLALASLGLVGLLRRRRG